jgi:hypothetical protein
MMAFSTKESNGGDESSDDDHESSDDGDRIIRRRPQKYPTTSEASDIDGEASGEIASDSDENGTVDKGSRRQNISRPIHSLTK